MSNVRAFPRKKAPGAAYPIDAIARSRSAPVLDALAGADVAYRAELEEFARVAEAAAFSVDAAPEVVEAVHIGTMCSHIANLETIRGLGHGLVRRQAPAG